MRKVLSSLVVLLFVGLQAARADVKPSAAPADEYFGPYKQSILEIRNRLSAYDVRDGSAMLDPAVPSYLDHLQMAICDWQHKYPRDPWLPAIFAHLVREYWRAGQASSAEGRAAIGVMRSAFPDSAETAATMSLIYTSSTALTRTAAPAPAGDISSYATPDDAPPPLL